MNQRASIGATTFLALLGLMFLTPDGSGAADAPAPREIKIEKRYLNLPVKNGAPKRRMAVRFDDGTVREFEIELAPSTPDLWVFLDVSPFKGQKAVITVQPGKGDVESSVQAIYQADAIHDQETLYEEALRPQFHFSSRRGWNNDPNGLVFYKGEYHLYYQHNPYGIEWGNMHWGHATSKDLVHWTEHPIALYPYKFGDWAFSGSAVVDWKNTSGLRKGREHVLVAGYTSTGRGECIVFSNDKGKTWTEYEGNPVVKHQGRDPKLLWHEPSKEWVMAVYDEFEKGRHIAFYTSPNFRDWTFQSRISGFFECPDLFELPVQGRPGESKWVLSAANSEYMLGSFDGRRFVPETKLLPGHTGNGFYAAQTFSDIPTKDGRRIQIGWGQMPAPGMPFNQMMCFPTEMSLLARGNEIRVAWQPVSELKKLRTKSWKWRELEVAKANDALRKVDGELFEIRVKLPRESQGKIVFDVRGVEVAYDFSRAQVSCGGKTSTLPMAVNPDSAVDLVILVDRTSFEIFADQGLVYMPVSIKAKPDNRGLRISSERALRLSELEVYRLRSAWN